MKKFESIVLIDDFTASGSSFIRKKNGEWGGKLPKFFDAINGKQEFKELFVEGFEIHLYFLIATKIALSHITSLLDEYTREHAGIAIKVDCIQKLYDDANFTNHMEQEAKDMLSIIEKPCYINELELTKAYKESYPAGDKRYHLGYKQCALTVVLNHNTPNNSLPIIWQPKKKGNDPLYPLFYRITRH